jgi:hypothetical protein
MAKNTVDDVHVTGHVKQTSDVPSTDNSARKLTAASLDQQINSKTQTMSAFGVKGTGRGAIIAVTIVAVCYLLYLYFR